MKTSTEYILATKAPTKTGVEGVPYSYWRFGGTDPRQWDEAKRRGRLQLDVPNNHDTRFSPVTEPTLSTGTATVAIEALTYLCPEITEEAPVKTVSTGI
ncbi:hypothetical protein MMC25_005147 [Agyrium rufum]|nr:hypothetical protein [Agyrium rufum]